MRPLLGLFLAALLLVSASAHALTDAEAGDLAVKAANGSEEARRTIEQAAEKGDMLAEHTMGLMFITGQGQVQSDSQALDWFLRAARKGHVESQHNAALIYERTSGTLNDPALARGWYRRAAQAGYARSQANLGNQLLEGIGGAPDVDEAREWIEKAAAQNEPRGQYLLGMLMLEGRAGVPRNPELAARQIAAAANGKDREAQYRLALLYGTGTGVEKSDAKALEQQLSGGKSSGPSFSAAHFSLRAHRIENSALAGSSPR